MGQSWERVTVVETMIGGLRTFFNLFTDLQFSTKKSSEMVTSLFRRSIYHIVLLWKLSRTQIFGVRYNRCSELGL